MHKEENKMTKNNAPIKNRYDFMLIFDVKDGNPNGSPDHGNAPRIDSETGQGYVTDCALKRKIRNYVQTLRGEEAGYEIHITEGAVLSRGLEASLVAAVTDKGASAIFKDGKVPALTEAPKAAAKKGKAKKDDTVDAAEDEDGESEEGEDSGSKNKVTDDGKAVIRQKFTGRFFDARAFGSVLTGVLSGVGSIRGPVQFTFARSIDPIQPEQVTVTRCAVASEKEAAKKASTMGTKHFVPYGLYVGTGSVSAPLAEKTGFSDEDLNLLWEAIINMFTDDMSASRGRMSLRHLIIFKHEDRLGNARPASLFDLVGLPKAKVDAPRDFSDYTDIVKPEMLPEGVSVEYRPFAPKMVFAT
jgi:CRISPR-associated protein Csd2